MSVTPLAAAIVTFGAGLVLVPLVRALARRTGMVCAPRADRWHTRPTALLGGVGIFAAFAVGLATTPELLGVAWSTVAAATLLFLVGLVDDVVQLRPLVKLAFQLAAAGIFIARGRVLPWTHDPVLDGAITVVWVVGIGNAMNLLDNMDGLAAGVAAIASVFLGITFWMNGQHELLALPAIAAGASLAFLVFNFKPASIFMGDSGSLFLGTLLAGIGLLSTYGRSRSVASVLLTPVLIMAIPILDTTLVTITRKLRGQPVSQGGLHKLLYVVGQDVLSAMHRRPHARQLQQRQRTTWAGAHRHPTPPARVGHQGYDVAFEVGIDIDPLHGLAHGQQLAGVGHHLQVKLVVLAFAPPAQDFLFVRSGRIAHRKLHQKPVELGLRQRKGSLVFDGILSSHDDKRLGQAHRLAFECHLILLHRLQERRLRLG